MNRAAFDCYVETERVRRSREGDIVILDNLFIHKRPKAASCRKESGAQIPFPQPGSSDVNPIGEAFAKLKTHSRKAKAHLRRALARYRRRLWPPGSARMLKFPRSRRLCVRQKVRCSNPSNSAMSHRMGADKPLLSIELIPRRDPFERFYASIDPYPTICSVADRPQSRPRKTAQSKISLTVEWYFRNCGMGFTRQLASLGTNRGR